jgi:hypothetical protein
LKITIQIIEKTQHRPGISGCDWTFDQNGDLTVSITKMSDWRREVALGFHEAAEAVLCLHNGVTQKMVDDFDVPFERDHPNSKIEAGDQSDAPYKREHSLATAIERILAAEFGIDWADYDRELEAL